MTKTRCKTLYGTCSFSVTTRVGVFLAGMLALAPASAQTSDTFAEFQARCLTPMVDVRDTDVSGLTRVPHRAAWETWRLDDAQWEMQRALPEAVVQYCVINGPFGGEVDVWVEAALGSGNYVAIDRTPQTLQSTFLREPLIEVEIDRDAERPSLTVIETNLES